MNNEKNNPNFYAFVVCYSQLQAPGRGKKRAFLRRQCLCQANEKESGCKADCGGFEGITKKQCAEARGHWNDCGSPCAGTGAEICIEVCQAQCECSGIAGFNCPQSYKCRLSGKIADEMGVCVKE